MKKKDIETEMYNALLKWANPKNNPKKRSGLMWGLNSKEWRDKTREERKRGMSPNAFDTHAKKLIEKGLIEKEVISPKNVLYKPILEKGIKRTLNEITDSIETFFTLVEGIEWVDADASYQKPYQKPSLPYETVTLRDFLEKAPTWKDLIENMTDDQLTQLRGILGYLIESIERYQNKRKMEVKE